MNKIKIVRWKVTTYACPFQIEGYTSKGDKVYIRERWDILRVDIDDKQVFRSCEDVDTPKQVFDELEKNGFKFSINKYYKKYRNMNRLELL